MSTPLNPTRLQRAEHYFSIYAVVLPEGTSLDDAMKPEYWVHVANRLRQHDTIRIIPEDGGYFAEALVTAAGHGFAKVKLLRYESLEEDGAEPAETDPSYVKWGGPHSKWRVIRRSDGQVLKEGLTKPDALREAIAYNSKVG